MIETFLWIILSLVFAAFGSNRDIGYGLSFIACLFLSPIIGLIIILYSPVKNYSNIAANDNTKLAWDAYKKSDYIMAIDYTKKALSEAPKDGNINFNMACLYSLTNQLDLSKLHLNKAVEYGYVKFDNILTNKDLDNLRKTSGFQEFKNKGFKF